MTTKKEQLLGYYETLLTTLDISIEEGGGLTHSITKTPIIVGGKRLSFPNKEVLTRLHDEPILAFHPLSENVYSNMSEVLVELRYMITSKLHRIISGLGFALIKTVVNAAAHEDLSDNQLEIISPISMVDMQFCDNYEKLINSLSVLDDPRLVSLYIKRGGTLGDKKYTRLVGVSFPLIEHIMTTDDPVINGVKFRKKDIASLRALFDIILPEAATPDFYSSGSNSNVAPYLMALLRAYANVLQATAGIGWDFRSATKTYMGYSLHVKASLIEDMIDPEDGFPKLTSVIPALPGNTGDGDAKNHEDDSSEKATQRVMRASREQADEPPQFARGNYQSPEPTVEEDLTVVGTTTTTVIAPRRQPVETAPLAPRAVNARQPAGEQRPYIRGAGRPAEPAPREAAYVPSAPSRAASTAATRTTYIRGQGNVEHVDNGGYYDQPLPDITLAPYDPYAPAHAYQEVRGGRQPVNQGRQASTGQFIRGQSQPVPVAAPVRRYR